MHSQTTDIRRQNPYQQNQLASTTRSMIYQSVRRCRIQRKVTPMAGRFGKQFEGNSHVGDRRATW